jgi:hypothetical protein
MTATGPTECPNDDGRAGAAMPALAGDDCPEAAAPGGLAPWVRHRRAGLAEEDAIGAAQMPAHVVDHGHRVELRGIVAPVGRRKPPKRPTDPVAGRAAVEMQPLSPRRSRPGSRTEGGRRTSQRW